MRHPFRTGRRFDEQRNDRWHCNGHFRLISTATFTGESSVPSRLPNNKSGLFPFCLLEGRDRIRLAQSQNNLLVYDSILV